MLKVLIDSYYASTRFTTIEIRKQLRKKTQNLYTAI